MTTKSTFQTKYVLTLAFVSALANIACAADSVPMQSAYTEAVPARMTLARQFIKSEQYERALDILKAEFEKNPNDADVNNLLGYSNRKLKRYDLALTYYQKALAINPQHRGANNYIAHLYLETNNQAKAEEHLAVLDRACRFGCEEYSELKQALKSYRGAGTTSASGY